MLKLAIALMLVAAPERAPSTLTKEEMVDLCADELPRQLACKEEFCKAMVGIRSKLDVSFRDARPAERLEVEQTCGAEIEADAAGERSLLRERCLGWAIARPMPPLSRKEAQAHADCWKKVGCKAQIDCWSPLAEQALKKQMAAMPQRAPKH